ncbi:MAG: type II toxin-antitoxin system HicB family antitoxin [Beijerinckiaceae bacterium]|nr:type II toxin-antitoxin system HicB family antitoxin [Beijerinckiaceae bacterium]
MAHYIGIIDGSAGAYGVVFPDLPGCASMGATIDEAFRNGVEAVRLWVEDARGDGDSVPEPRDMDALRADEDVKSVLAEGGSFVSVPLLLDTGRPARANVSIDAGLLAAIDEAAKERGLTRSAFIASAARDKIAKGA